MPTLVATPSSRMAMLSHRTAYWLSAAVIGIAFLASVTPSPLYGSYARMWQLSPLMLTLVYATYAFGILATLLVAGRASDQVGRRPVLLAALTGLAASMVLFVEASSPAWLFVARGLQGLATGAAISTASAALLDLHAKRDPVRVSQTNAVLASGGLAIGILMSAVIVELELAPLTLPYAIVLALSVIALLGVVAMPEPVQQRSPLVIELQRPQLPAVVRRPFLHASLAVLASWSLGGLFFSLGPQLAARVFDTRDIVIATSGIVVLCAFAALGQLAFGRAKPWLTASAGSALLAIGTLMLVGASTIESGAAFLASAAIAGVGFGLAFLGGLRSLVAVIPAAQRAGVMSAFFLVAYTALSIPAVIAGLVVARFGLISTFQVFGVIVAAIAAVLAFEAYRTRAR